MKLPYENKDGMKLPYENKDGIKRNKARIKYEWKIFREHITNQPKSHDPITNLFVEFSRATPWLAGHVWLLNNVLWLIACIILS